MLGCTNGAMRACSFAVSSLVKTRTAFFAAPEATSFARMPQVSARCVTRRSRVAGSIASTQMVDAAGQSDCALLQALRTDGEVPVVHVPQGERQRREALQVVVVEDLLLADVDALSERRQLRQRREVVGHHPVGTDMAAVDPRFENKEAFQSA